MTTTATRQIGIDMGHRVVDHASKCKNLHGHRYTIEATVGGNLASEGEQDGMVLDFGFLKDLMMEHIDAPCDHGTTLSVHDNVMAHTVGPFYEYIKHEVAEKGYSERNLAEWPWGKLYVIGHTPTAENLARHWFDRMATHVPKLTQNRAHLVSVKVWETPNCWVEYVAP